MYFISAIHIYPIKSMGGLSLEHSEVTPKGLKYDRRYMLVDEEGVFLSQRSNPEMALFSLKWLGNGFEIEKKGKKIILPSEGKDWVKCPKKVSVRKSSVTALSAPKPFNDWFSEQLGMACTLVYMPEKSKRSINPIYAGKGQTVSFADGYPILLANTESLGDLNQKIKNQYPEKTMEAIRMSRFRPNLIFEGNTAWEEDAWKGFSIGGLSFKCAKPCARCTVVNINQERATKSPEVLATLAKHRRAGNKVLFGMNVVWENFGQRKGKGSVVNVGDRLVVRT